ncbi:MAG: aldehyde ferredoxin oxidoreductase family protein [Thermoplasmata archaeon]|nr:aldehyde ferredoxin oxidoreductase family protein [Thermoplasmata archaeon]
MFGYNGKILRVDLSRENIKEEKLDEKFLRKFMGGTALGAHYLMKETKKGLHPLENEAILFFGTGPLTCSGLPGHSRFIGCGKSPLTGIWGEAHAGGFFSPELKKSGYDGLIVTGAAAQPKYLWIHDGICEIKDAMRLWGMYTGDVEKEIRNEVGIKAEVLSIGPAGEKQVPIANIIVDRNRALGRCGFGALMGAKKLKAIAAKGTGTVEWADPKNLREKVRELARRIGKENENFGKYGTAGIVKPLSQLAILPTKNFQNGSYEKANDISGEKMVDTILVRRDTCSDCTIGCKRVVKCTKEVHGWDVSEEYGGPEYETVASFGSLLLNSSLPAIARANQICNMYGVDTISAGVIIAFVLEGLERGLISEKDVGYRVNWGDEKGIIRLLEDIVENKGFGTIAGKGVKHMAQMLGKDAGSFAVQVKGLEVAMHEPRGKKGLGLNYATANRGGCHVASYHDTFFTKNTEPLLGAPEKMDRYGIEGKARMIAKTQDFCVLGNSLIVCQFTHQYGAIKVPELLQLVNLATGFDYSLEEFFEIGERGFILQRMFNEREGCIEDGLPPRFHTPLPEVTDKGVITHEEFTQMLSEYYSIRGIDPNGRIKNETITRLGLDAYKL